MAKMEKQGKHDKTSWSLNEEKRVNKLKIKRAQKWDVQREKEELTEDALAHLELNTDNVKEKYFGVRKGKKFREELNEEKDLTNLVEGRRADWYQTRVETEAAKLQEQREKAEAKEQEELIKKLEKQKEKSVLYNYRVV